MTDREQLLERTLRAVEQKQREETEYCPHCDRDTIHAPDHAMDCPIAVALGLHEETA